jgi:hypothetical protein
MIIRNSNCPIVDKEDNVILTGTRQKGLYYLDKEYLFNLYDNNIDESKYYEDLYLNFRDKGENIYSDEDKVNMSNMNTTGCTDDSRYQKI